MSKPPFRSYLALAREVLDLAARVRASGELEDLVALHADALVIEWFDGAGVDEKTQRKRRNQLSKALVAAIAQDSEEHMESPLRESDVVDGAFVYSFADSLSAEDDDRDALARLRCVPELRDALAAMDDGDFERLCAHLLKRTGCDRVAVTRGSKDRGLDFLGRLPAAASDHVVARRILLGALHVVVVGQAKRYAIDRTVGPEEVRQLPGTWLATEKARANGTLPDHLVRTIDSIGVLNGWPAQYVVATTGSFTEEAVKEAADGGVALLDGRQLAYALASVDFGFESAAVGSCTTGVDVLSAACKAPF